MSQAAEALMRAGDWAGAAQALAPAAGRDPAALMNLATCWQQMGRWADAVAALRRVVAVAPPPLAGPAWYNLGNALSDLADHAGAVAAYRQAVTLRPHHSWSLANLALALRRVGGAEALAESEGHYRTLAARGDFPRAGEGLSQVLVDRARLDLAAGADSPALRRAEESDRLLGRVGALIVAPLAPAVTAPIDIADAAILPGGREWYLHSAAGLHLDGLHNANPEAGAYVRVLGESRAVFHLPEIRRAIDAPAFLLGGSANHYHWIIDYLPRLRFHDGVLPLVTDPRPTTVQREALRMLGLDGVATIGIGEAARAARLNVAPIGARRQTPHADALDWLRGTLGAAAGKGKGGAKVYVSRADAATRRVVNEAEITAALRRRGFTIVVPGTLSLARQIQVFRSARVVVAPHGAGLANLAFAPPGCRVVEISAGASYLAFIETLCAACGHSYRRLAAMAAPGPAQKGATQAENYDMRVNVAEVMAALDAVGA